MFENIAQKDYDEIKAWVKKQKHLPPFMRDFHDQKDLFKTIGSTPHPIKGDISWIDGHCYTIDKFLWVMAFHGYTLQKCRAKKPFQDIHEAITERREKESEAFTKMLEEEKRKEKEKVCRNCYDWQLHCGMADGNSTCDDFKPHEK